jgi:hypothetical protein
MDRDSCNLGFIEWTETAVPLALWHGQKQLYLQLYGMDRDSCKFSFIALTETAVLLALWH